MGDTSLIFNIFARDKTKAGFDQVKAGAAVAGAAIGAALVAGIGTMIEKSKLDNKVAMQLGATPAQAAAIGKLSGSVYADGFGEDMPAVAAAIKSAGQQGLLDMENLSGEAAKKTTANLLTVGTVLEEDTTRVSAAVSTMLKTGMAKSSEEAMDMIVAATQKGINKGEDLLDTLIEYPIQFKELGLSGQDAMGLINQGLQAGARNSDVVADGLKEIAIRAQDGSAKSAAAFAALGLNADEMGAKFAAGGASAREAFQMVFDKTKAIEDPMKKNAIAVGLFGTKAEDMQDALFAMDLGTAANEMNGMAGATKRASDQSKQGAAGWSVLGRQLQMALVDTLNKALPAVNAVFGFMQRNSSWVQPLAIGLGILAVAIGVVVAVQWAWNAALAVSPVTWIIIGIVALVAVIVLVATKTTFFQTIWKHVWGFMKSVGAWFAGPFANFFVQLWNKLVAGFNWVKNGIGSAISWVKNLFVGWFNYQVTLVRNIITKFTSMVNFFKSIPGKIKGALGNMFAPLWNGFRGFVNRIISGWNNLSFGIPGFSFAGINVPGIRVNTPNIPYLATGGLVRQDGLAYLHAGETVTKKAQVTRTGPGAGSGGNRGGATITIGGSNSKVIKVLLELLREGIRDQGGDPVKVLTAR